MPKAAVGDIDTLATTGGPRPGAFNGRLAYVNSKLCNLWFAYELDRKIAAVKCYASQFEGSRFEGVEHFIRSSAGYEGMSAGYRYGESYYLPRPLGVTDLMQPLTAWPTPPPFDAANPPRGNSG